MPDHKYTLADLTRLEGDALKEALVAVLRTDVPFFNQYRRSTYYRRVDLKGADLPGTNLIRADLRRADLRRANLTGANLGAADLRNASLRDTKLSNTNLSSSDLCYANLRNADLYNTDLSSAYMRDADLAWANLHSTRVRSTNFSGTNFSNTVLSGVDLSEALNLERAVHSGPSTIGIDTLERSGGNIPDAFLEDCGVSETIRAFAKSLVGQAIEFDSCFISYSHADEEFAQHLHMNLRSKGVRVWYAPEDMKMGGKLHEQIYEAIHLHDRLLLVLSEHSIKSNWVRTEIRRAYKRQLEEERQVLFPISLMSYEQLKAWESFFSDDGIDLAQEIREYFIGDFSTWKDHDTFQPLFEKLLAGLRASSSSAPAEG